MNGDNVYVLVRLEELTTQRLAMVTENEARARKGEAQAHPASDFWNLANEIHTLAERIR